MARYKTPDNRFTECVCEGEPCVVFWTEGKLQCKVTVDRSDWYSYLKDYSWTAIKQNNRIEVKTSVNKQSQRIWRMIIEHRYRELDYWGATIDHVNNDPLDNRLSNLRIFHAPILNSTNVSSKYQTTGMQYIHRQGSAAKPSGYKVHYNVMGQTFYKNFSALEYGTVEKALKAAKKYRDDVVLRQRDQIITEMIKKTRDIEFERGLRDKLQAGEREEVKMILQQYGIFSSM